MTLSSLLFPKKNICTETELYFHADSATYDESRKELFIPKGATVAFDSYFNSFPASQYARYTTLSHIDIALTFSGKATVSLCAASLQHGAISERVLQECSAEGSVTLTASLSDFVDATIFYPVIHALEDVRITAGTWTSLIEETERNVHLSVVICTYRREEFVYRNIAALPDSTADFASVLVIDNGHTLDAQKIARPFVTVIPNKNLGGSGGFTRGIMETLLRRDAFSHVLLMDDDITFEPSLLARTRAFLAVLRPEYADYALGGALLNLEKKYIQSENGADLKLLKSTVFGMNFDFRETNTIIKNMKINSPMYNGWWFCCMPLKVLKKDSLPFPFFIHVDDMEFGVRYFCKRIILINGISVWHHTFEEKVSPVINYYNVRNGLIAETVTSGMSFPKFLFVLLTRYGKRLLTLPYAVEFMTQALLDYLKGPDFLLGVDGEALNTLLREKQAWLEKKHRPAFYYYLSTAGNLLRFSVLFIAKRKTILQYRTRFSELTSWKNWSARLGLSE